MPNNAISALWIDVAKSLSYLEALCHFPLKIFCAVYHFAQQIGGFLSLFFREHSELLSLSPFFRENKWGNPFRSGNGLRMTTVEVKGDEGRERERENCHQTTTRSRVSANVLFR